MRREPKKDINQQRPFWFAPRLRPASTSANDTFHQKREIGAFILVAMPGDRRLFYCTSHSVQAFPITNADATPNAQPLVIQTSCPA
jgi:hypothetical protein